MAEKKKTTSADTRSRATKHRHAQQQDIRDKFKGIEYIRQLELIAKELEELQKSIDKLINERAKLYTKDHNSLTATQKQKKQQLTDKLRFLNTKLDIIMKRAELNFKRLRFVLPELKSIELTDSEAGNPFSNLLNTLKEVLQETPGG